MKIIYHCYGSAHSSVVCAAIHMGLLPTDRRPSGKELMQLSRFDRTTSEEIGTVFFIGRDDHDNEVCILGMAGAKRLVKNTIYSLLELFDISTKDIVLVETLKHVNLITKIGGILSRRFGLVSIGRPLVISGIRKNYFDYVNLVKSVKESLSSQP